MSATFRLRLDASVEKESTCEMAGALFGIIHLRFAFGKEIARTEIYTRRHKKK
jgi:hypothetical protein